MKNKMGLHFKCIVVIKTDFECFYYVKWILDKSVLNLIWFIFWCIYKYEECKMIYVLKYLCKNRFNDKFKANLDWYWLETRESAPPRGFRFGSL